MAFFLLGRIDDTLTLLCPDTFATRQDALAALSRVTAEPDFSMWGAEVLLLDTDAGTPVLLLRPAVATPVDVSAPFEQPVAELFEDIVLVDDTEQEPFESVVVEELLVAVSETTAEPESVEDGAIADAIVDEYEYEHLAEPTEHLAEPFEHDTEPSEQDAAATLKDALTRTAAHMESEGVVAPESVGSAHAAVFEPAEEAAWPWDLTAEPRAEEPGGDLEVVTAETPLTPVSTDFALHDLEEPSLDDGSILRTTIDDETFAAARPLIMGSYTDAPPIAEFVTEPEPSLTDDVFVRPAQLEPAPPSYTPAGGDFAMPVVADPDDIFPLEPQADTPVEPLIDDELALDESVESRDISDFILDLGPVPSGEPSPAAPQSDLADYTCKECVYEESCPNKDQRLPKDCGSFQWR